MAAHGRHTVHAVHHHFGWDRSLSPVLRVTPGSTVAFECHEASGGQITAISTATDVPKLDFARVNPVNGPVLVEGAQPGDVLKVTIESFVPSGFGWTAVIPGFGLLADDFKTPALHLWRYEAGGRVPANFATIGRVPIRPFAGTIGVAPAEPGLHSIVPPRRVGGNMDIRDLSAGVELYLPIEVEGALFSVGDTHAAQGDGEVCGTAIESPMTAVLTLDVIKGSNIESPRFTTPGSVTRHVDTKGYEVTTGIGPDLMQGARDAVRRMIDLLCRRHALAAADAYMLCSVAGDLRVSEIVDMPNWVVSFYFPRIVLD
ncbi:MAG: acetamidase [Alphaproteobacteria bacterium]|nr:acetamidase [Alphaproteobacteria bacterium]